MGGREEKWEAKPKSFGLFGLYVYYNTSLVYSQIAVSKNLMVSINAIVNRSKRNNMTESKHYLNWCSPFDHTNIPLSNVQKTKLLVFLTVCKHWVDFNIHFFKQNQCEWHDILWLKIGKLKDSTKFDWWWTLEREGLKWSPPPSNLFSSNKIEGWEGEVAFLEMFRA